MTVAPVSPLISVHEAAARLAAGAVAVDCSFDLADPTRGERDYRARHLPDAVYAHLDRDLSDHTQRGRGRHPLPHASDFTATLSRWGITPDTEVIAYDDANGAHAARLWWMLRLLGHARVQVLDGGLRAWQAAGLPVGTIAPSPQPTHYEGAYDVAMIASTADVDVSRDDATSLLLDARAAPRFRGEVEPIDPVAGHVPGARNRPFADNLQADGTFKPAAQLRAEYEALLAGRDPRRVVMMCGSGVTACHDLLALEQAGFSGARVYAGSWSEWIGDASRPVARGD